MTIFYTSDNHFNHKNIIGYCARPYANVDEMHEDMIRRWNAVVGADDVVYHLGDFGFGSFESLRGFVQRLNGQKIIVKGNHDKGIPRLLEMGFQAACNSMEREDGGVRWLLIHNPYGVTAKNVLCGHVHEKWERKGNVINVGVDVRNFTPVTIEQLRSRPEKPGTPPIETMPCPGCGAAMEWAKDLQAKFCRQCGHRE